MMNALKNALIWSAKKYEKNPSTFMNVTTAACFSLLCVGEAFAIMTNKNIPEKQKHFMVPQALGEGALNVGIILGVSTALQKFGSSLVKQGKIIPRLLPKSIKDPKIIAQIIDAKELSDLAHSNIKGLNQKVFDRVKSFHKGAASVAGPLTGLFLAQNILIPALTNKFAAKYSREMQKKELQHTKEIKADFTPVATIRNNSTVPAFQSMSRRINPYSAFSRTSAYYGTYLTK